MRPIHKSIDQASVVKTDVRRTTPGNLSKPPARFECKAHGAAAPALPAPATLAHPCAAQEPQCTCWYMRIPSTAQRSNRAAQEVSRGSHQSRECLRRS